MYPFQGCISFGVQVLVGGWGGFGKCHPGTLEECHLKLGTGHLAVLGAP